MAASPQRRLTAAELESDSDALLAVRELTDYSSLNPAFSLTGLDELARNFTLADEDERRLEHMLDAARDTSIAASWARHNGVLGARAQVIAQYGHDSNAIQSLGLKKKSERKRPARRALRETTTQ